MPLPESKKIQKESAVPRLWQRSRGVLTGGVIAVMLALIAIWQFSDYLGLEIETRITLVLLILALVFIWVLVLENRARIQEYRQATAAIYQYHPLYDEGIDVQSVRTFEDPSSKYREREACIGIESRENKVLFFTCDGNVVSVKAFLKKPGESLWLVSRTETGRLPVHVLAPTMFEVNPKGQAGNLWLRISDENVRIVSIEWRDPHIKSASSQPSTNQT